MWRLLQRHIAHLSGIACLMLCFSAPASAQSSTITYQGRLTDGGTAANGTYDLQFKLYDALTNGNLQGSPSTVAKTGVNVTNGIFTVQLDFGAGAFPGADRYLEISVQHNAGGFVMLSPRQQLTSTPYAIRSLSAASADTATTATTATNNVLKGGDTMTGLLVLSGNPVTNLGAATKQYVDSGDALKLNLSGGTMTGALDMSSNKITSLATPTAGTDAANKSYVDSVVTGAFPWVVVSGTSQQAQANTGYIANNASLVTITLPASPNIGDIVRVSGAGAGGWRISANAGQFLNGPAGANWTARDSNRTWNSVASSADGSKLVTVVFSGQIYTSTDSGVSWTPRDSNRNWNSVASSADGSKLVAVVGSGQIYTSTDSGVSWTPRDSNRTWNSVASSADGSKLVTVVFSGQIYTSTDSGVNWTPRDSNRNWISVASSADGSKLVTVVSNGQIYTSTDSGVNWTPRDSSRLWQSVASSADGSKLVAVVGGGQIYTSTDSGVSWTPRDSNRNWNSVASSADGSKLVAVVGGGQIYTSTDSGVSWTPRDSSRAWQSVASSADGSKLVAVERGGQIYPSSVNAITINGELSSAVQLLYIGSGRFLVLSHEGTITGQ